MTLRPPASPAIGALFAIAGAMCWSTGGLFVRATDGVDGWQIIHYRSWVVLIVMGLWMLARHGRRLPGIFAHAGIVSVIAGIALGMAGLTFVMSLFYVTVAQAIFMTGISPFAAAILARLIVGERIRATTWVAMVIALAGLGVMFAGSKGGGELTGIFLALASGFSFSCYNVALRRGQNRDMMTAILWNALFLVLASLIVLMLPSPLRSGETGLVAFTVGWWNLAMITGMAAIQLCLGLYLFTKGSRSLPAAELALLALVEPMLSPIWVWLAFNEVPSLWVLAGGGIILAAIVMQTLASTRGAAEAKTAAAA